MKNLTVFIALLFSVGVALAQPVISGIAADVPSRSTVRIRWTTDISATHKVEYGPTVAYGSIFTPGGSATTHSIPIGGLAGATTYNYRVCSTSGSETCSSNQTFVTTAEIQPRTATAPLEFSTAAPTSFTASATIVACADLQAQINTYASNDGNNNYRITVPVALACPGQWTLPAKTGANPNGTGIIVIQGAGTLYAPEGSTTAPIEVMPTLLANRVATRLLPFTPGDCYFLGDFAWDDDETTFSLKYVSSVSPCVYTAITAIGSGTTLPPTCVAGDWFYKTDVSGHNNRAHWCITINTWRQVTFVGDGEADTSYSAIVVAANAKGYRLVGIRIQILGWPANYTAQLTQHTRTIGSVNRCLASTPTTSTAITFDRVIFDGIGFPFRSVYGLCPLDGTNVAVVDSYFNEINRPVVGSGFEASANAIIMYAGPGPMKIQGNWFQNVHGIAIFASDETSLDQIPTNIVVRANYLYENPCHNGDDPCAVAGQFWMRRNGIELKRGSKWLIEGNIFDGGWPSITRGSCLSLTPRPGNVSVQNNMIQIVDIMIRSNWFKNCMEPASIAGSHDGYNINTILTQRVSVLNNLFSNGSVTSTGQTTGWPFSLTSRGYIHLTQQGPEDIVIVGNTYWDMRGSDRGDMVLSLDALKGSGLQVYRNIYYPTPNSSGINGGGFAGGTAALDAYWTSGAASNWGIAGNHWVQAPGVITGNYPTGITWYAAPASVGLISPATGDYRPAATSAAAAIGVNRDAVNAAQGIPYNARTLNITSTTASVYWTAPDINTPCTVEYAAGTRVVDTPGGSRIRNVALSGLAASTAYPYTIYCGRRLAGTFTTKP